MKKYSILCICIFTLLVYACNVSKDDKPTNFAQILPDSGKLILSIPDWALDVTIKNMNQQPCNPENLQLLNGFNTQLDTLLLKNVNAFPKYTVTRKINPCCPCTSGGRDCCVCMGTIYFASPTSMNATVTDGDGSTLTKDATYNGTGVDVFTVTKSAATDTVIISGTGMAPTPFIFN